MEKEVASVSSGFDHVAALNKAGFAVRGVKKFRKGWPAFGNDQSVQQQAVLMGMLEPKTTIQQVDPEVRVERRERERQRLTAALDSVLNTVSPYRSIVIPLRNKRLRTDVEVPQQVENDAEVRVALRELFANPEPIKSKASLLQRMLQYRIEFVPPWHSLFQRDDRKNIIGQLKEVYK